MNNGAIKLGLGAYTALFWSSSMDRWRFLPSLFQTGPGGRPPIPDHRMVDLLVRHLFGLTPALARLAAADQDALVRSLLLMLAGIR